MIPATLEELEAIRKECRSMVNTRAFASGGTALVPIPGTDVVADVGMLMQLLPAINDKFGLSEKQLSGMDAESKAAIYGLVMSMGSAVIGKLITRELVIKLLQKVGVRMAAKQAARIIPIAGHALSAALSFSAMRYVGNKHVEDCYNVARQLIEQRRAKELEIPADAVIVDTVKV
ncbi:hypothetical protein PUW24_05955 [Paenibacillus urinalis]|uniref:DUF697 domain-containing protein n=1 Tax=Paenibacillus urinalis TaxID=521520 RepID=A0AAX3MZ67_9BACL|nr:hypothetical protein [Paenibacillus urinalis]WDH82411.1 hypothetical protein PUW23_23685 [Paenibacillus urinalis]WDH98470.1 hypothetical protein PUW24_05955 [Paenibacillus urinalis]WDI02159.1 hypothetical protein PUW25_23680 [Paenibacillus urinalis]